MTTSISVHNLSSLPQRKLLIYAVSIILLFSCKKNESPPVITDYKGSFSILEEVGDTLLPVDTTYTFKRITFIASKEFRTTNWIIGNSLDSFSSRSVSQYFPESDEINITLTGLLHNKRDTSISKHLTIYQPSEHISPLVGRYSGYNMDDPNDTFSVSVKFWFGARYSFWGDGAYSIENLPKDYKDSTQNFNGYYRPEFLGILLTTSYKNMAFNMSGYVPAQGIKGYASLQRGSPDTLIINYTLVDYKKFDSTNIITYIQKKFIGVRK